MLLETTIKTEKKYSKEIELPYYCKSGESYYYKVVSESRVLAVCVMEIFPEVKLWEMRSSLPFIDDIAKGEQVTEGEFEEAKNWVLNSIVNEKTLSETKELSAA
jgi:hypothetical protein